MKKISNILWGIAFIIVGVVIALNALEITNINLFFSGWWTLFIIVPCFIGLFKEESKTGNIIGLIIGSMLFLACQKMISFNLVWKLFIPIILIIVGISFIFKDFLNKEIKEQVNKLSKTIEGEYVAIFGGQKIDLSNETFKGTEVNAIFGGIDINLREAKILEDVVINATAIFGGVTIKVPKNVKVKVSSTPIFGGVSNERKNPKTSEITIFIKSLCLFGGVDIK